MTRALSACFVLLTALPPVSARAQVPTGGQLPSGQRGQELLQNNPALADSLRQRLRDSRMTSDQVRARLRASGYPESVLDAYLGGSTTPGMGSSTPTPIELNAMQALGLPPLLDSLPLDTGFIRLRGGETVAKSKVFGVDAFRRTTTQFMPLLAGPVPPDYHLGPGDALVLILTGDVELMHPLTITREGFVLIPQVGQVFAANLTVEQLRDVLYSRLGRIYSGVKRGPGATTRFDVTVANIRANQVYVVGEVTQPGAYQISSLATVVTALYAAGGVTERANLRGVEVQRDGKTVAVFDLYDYLLKGIARSDVRVETGDVIFVPVHGRRAQVAGAVVRPATYELKSGETLADLIRSSGGFRSDAQLRRVAVHRILPIARQSPARAPRAVVDVELTVPDSGSLGRGNGDGLVGGVVIPPIQIEDGDSVFIDSTPPLRQGYYVVIAGMVNKPASYAWQPGMTLRDLVLLARGPRTGALLNEAEIARLPDDPGSGTLATTIRVPLDSTYLFERDSLGRYVGPPGLPFPGPGAPEVLLTPFDNVLLFGQPDFELQRGVTILGQVLYPGTYSLRTKSDRISALVERAGGLTPQAYPEGVRFTRATAGTGRINANLPAALRTPGGRDDVILQRGDSITIPEFLPTVKVTGAVNSPTSILFKPGAGLGYYIGAAGGFARNADKRTVSVKLANGDTRTKSRFLWFTSSPTTRPGAEVFVPFRDPNERGIDFVSVFGTLAQVLASTVAIIVLVRQSSP